MESVDAYTERKDVVNASMRHLSGTHLAAPVFAERDDVQSRKGGEGSELLKRREGLVVAQQMVQITNGSDQTT